MKKIVTLLCVVIIAYPLYVMSSVYLYSFESADAKADAAIVLGAAVWGGDPSPVFEERIKHSIKLHTENQVSTLIFTGGVGDGDTQSEAAVARAYAINQGIPADQILIEDKSTITRENLIFAKELLSLHQVETVLLVSDPLHMKRAMTMAEDIGLYALPSPTTTSRYKSFSSKAKMLLSESYYFIGYQLGKLTR